MGFKKLTIFDNFVFDKLNVVMQCKNYEFVAKSTRLFY